MANNRKRLLAAAAATALAASLAACGGSSSDGGSNNDKSSAQGEAGGTLTYLLASPLGHIDPQRIYVGRDISNFGRTTYRQLVTF